MRKIVTMLSRAALVALCISMSGCATTASSTGNSARSPDGAKKGGKGEAGASAAYEGEPAWVSNPRNSFPEERYVSAVGYGENREAAEKSAMGALVAVFGQTVKGETTVSSRYLEAVKSGALEVSESTDVGRAVTSSFALETVVGAEIKGVWEDRASTTYAVAVMDKLKASMLYSDLIESNESSIRALTAIPDSDRFTMEAYARHDLAAEIAETSGRFLNVLSVVNPGAAAARRGTTTRAEDLRVAALKIAQGIPIAVSIKNDRDGRVAAAFSSVLTAAGFMTGGTGSRYALSGSLALSPVELPDNPNKFSRFTVDATLRDEVTGNALLPYSASGRDGHTTQGEADNRAVRAAERKVRGEFGTAFTAFVSGLGGKK